MGEQKIIPAPGDQASGLGVHEGLTLRKGAFKKVECAAVASITRALSVTKATAVALTSMTMEEEAMKRLRQQV